MGRKQKDFFKTPNFRNAVQVIAGAGIFSMLVFATNTVSAPTIQSGLVITVFIYVLTALALIGIFRMRRTQNTFKHLVLATVVSYPIAVLGGIFWAGESFETLTSIDFFTSVAHIAFLIGVFSGALTDAKTR